MKHYILLTVFLGGLFLTSNLYSQAIKVGIVDLQKAILSVQDGKVAKDRLEKIFKEKKTILEKKKAELQQFTEDLKKQSDNLKSPVPEEKQKEFQKKYMNLQLLYTNAQKDLQEKQATLMKKILDRMEVIIRKIGVDGGYTTILEKTELGVLYYPKHLDLTDKVILLYNQSLQPK